MWLPTREFEVMLISAEHAVKWYQDKVRKSLTEHQEMEAREGKVVDYSIPEKQKKFNEEDAVCQLLGPEIEW